MKQKILSITILCCLALFLAGCTGAAAEGEQSGPSAAQAEGKGSETTFTGYLVDVKCGYAGKSRLDGTDLTLHPETHTLACALSDESVASGYGLFMKDENGVYKFFPFDADGSRMAREVLSKSVRKDGILVKLIYIKNGDDINLASITEIDKVEEAPKAETHE